MASGSMHRTSLEVMPSERQDSTDLNLPVDAEEMPAEFDPYRELLGIVTPNRPPDHYALLGLELFESNRQKIDDAATERMGKLQDLANSDLVDHSQRLLNELSAARRCLLNAVQKVAYDEALRTKTQRAKLSGSGNQSQGKVSWKQQPLIITAIGGTVVLLLLIVVFLLRGPANNANLIIDWAPADRAGGVMYVDAKPRELPPTEPMRFTVSEGRHMVEFQRPGFRNIQQRIQVSKAAVRLKLRWIPVKR